MDHYTVPPPEANPWSEWRIARITPPLAGETDVSVWIAPIYRGEPELQQPIWLKDLIQWTGVGGYERMLARTPLPVLSALAAARGDQNASRIALLQNTKANTHNFARAVLDPDYVEALELLTQWRSMYAPSCARVQRITNAIARLDRIDDDDVHDAGATLAWIIEDFGLARFTSDFTTPAILELLRKMRDDYAGDGMLQLKLATRISENKHIMSMLAPAERESFSVFRFNQGVLLERLQSCTT